jgi:hypothetical protein
VRWSGGLRRRDKRGAGLGGINWGFPSRKEKEGKGGRGRGRGIEEIYRRRREEDFLPRAAAGERKGIFWIHCSLLCVVSGLLSGGRERDWEWRGEGDKAGRGRWRRGGRFFPWWCSFFSLWEQMQGCGVPAFVHLIFSRWHESVSWLRD